MQYHINHVHVRAQDPHASAAWYEKYFNARKLWAREIMPGTVTVSMEVGGPGPAQHLLQAGRKRPTSAASPS